MQDIVLFDDLPSTDSSWDIWRQMMTEEGWTNADCSIRELAPTLSQTKSVAAKDKDGKTISHIVWYEYDGLSNVSTYLTDKEYRGNGIGKRVWQRAMDRIELENTTMMLESVPEMTHFYKKWGYVVEGPKKYAYSAPWKVLRDQFMKISDGNEKKVQPITTELFDKWINFDRMVTGRDRKKYLERYFALEFTKSLCILDESGNISGTISIVPTVHKEKALYKISTLYTSSTQDAAALIVRSTQVVSELNDEAHIAFTLSSDTRGFSEFDDILANNRDILRYYACVLLTKKPYRNPVDYSKLFIAGNSDCHYDA